MPVKIIPNTGTTNPALGEITENDLEKIKHDFNYDTAVSPKLPRTAVYKRISFLFSKYQFKELFDTIGNDADLVRINIGIQLPKTKDVCGNIEQDAMCAVIEMAIRTNLAGENITNIIVPVGNFVLINGFEDNGSDHYGGQCCPSSDPPTGG